MNRLVIVGCGRLAEIITNAVVKGMLPDYELVGVYSRTASKAEHIANKMRQHGKMCAACHTLKELGYPPDCNLGYRYLYTVEWDCRRVEHNADYRERTYPGIWYP